MGPSTSNEELLMNYMEDVVFVALADDTSGSKYRIKTVEMACAYILFTFPNFSEIHRFLPTVGYAHLYHTVTYAHRAILGIQDVMCLYSPQLLNQSLTSEYFV